MNCVCGTELTGRQRKWCSEQCQKDGARADRLAKIFDLTPQEYKKILDEQGGGCAVCERPPERIALAVDHDHHTKWVRGILCTTCNLRVIARHRDPRILQRAADYLADPPARRALGRDVVAPGRPPKKRKPRRRKK